MYIFNLDVYIRISMYISLSCHINNDLIVLSLFNKYTIQFIIFKIIETDIIQTGEFERL